MMVGLLWARSECKTFSVGKGKGCGVREPEEPSLLPMALRYRFHCGLSCLGHRKENAKEKGRAAKTKREAERMEGRSQEDGGKKPSLAAAPVPAQNATGNKTLKQ